MPPWHLALANASAVTEICLGAWRLVRRWQGLAGWGLMALYPDLFKQFTPTGRWLRLPLQIVVIASAYWYTRPLA